MDFDHVLETCHSAADEFSRGNSIPVKELYSHRDDVALVNPFGRTVRGWKQVEEALDYAS